MIVDLDKEKLVMWAVCTAIGSQHELIDKIEKVEGEGILRDVKFIVGGVELNFLNVIEDINKNIDRMLNKKAKKLIEQKFDNLIDTIEDTKRKFIDNLENN